MGWATLQVGAQARETNRSRAGFTLVELMIVVAIIGLLAAIAIPCFVRARQTSQVNRFAADIRVACDAFIEYSFENGHYPPDTTPGVIPSGMSSYLSKMHWTDPTSLGGQWDWDNGQFGFKAGVSVYQPTADDNQMRRVDALIDDGSLSSGTFRSRSDGYINLIEN